MRLMIYGVMALASFLSAGTLMAATGATTRPDSVPWDAGEWVMFFGSLATLFAAGSAAVIAIIKEVFKQIRELRESTRANSQALVPLIDSNKADPGTANVDPAAEAKVRATANGTKQ